MTITLSIIIVIFIGLAGGLAVGAGFVAFITVLGIIPRLMQLTKSLKMIVYYEGAVIIGVMVGALMGLQEPVIPLPVISLVLMGLLFGVFVGMIAAALYEVLDVFPVLFKRINLHDRLLYLIMALVFGKVFGSLLQWMFFVKLQQ